MFNYSEKIKNLILKFYTTVIDYLPKYSTSEKYWNQNLVDTPLSGFKNINESIDHLKWRNIQYINSINILNLKQYDNKVILDFGCGPGNDIVNICSNSKPKKNASIRCFKKSNFISSKKG